MFQFPQFRSASRLMILSVTLLVCLPGTLTAQDAEVGAVYKRAVLIRFTGPIYSFSEQVLKRQLERAARMKADLVVVEIYSPGGEVESSFRCAEMLEAVNVPTVAWIPREALSGASIMALGCDRIVMRPTAQLGDAGPIYADEYGMFQHAPEKVRSNLSSRIRSLAERNGRSPALAQAMVDNTVVVHRVIHRIRGEQAFMTDNELAAPGEKDKWDVKEPVFKPNNKDFLEVTGTRAVELGLANAVAQDRQELATLLGMAGEWHVLQRTWIDTTVYVLNTPLVTVLLFLIGMVALFVEFSAPGVSLGGLLSALCFTLFFWGRFLGGTAGWLEVLLFLLGILFLLVEIFVIPGFGVAGLSGVLLIIVSLVMAGQDFLMPTTGSQWRTTGNSLLMVMGAGVGFIALSITMTRYYGGIPFLSRLALTPEPREDGPLEVARLTANVGQATAIELLDIGSVGIAETPLRPAGKAIFDDEFYDVVSEGEFVETGDQVRIMDIQGNRVIVRKVRG